MSVWHQQMLLVGLVNTPFSTQIGYWKDNVSIH